MTLQPLLISQLVAETNPSQAAETPEHNVVTRRPSTSPPQLVDSQVNSPAIKHSELPDR